MKVYEIQQFGIDTLKLTERPDPQLSYGHVLVKMRAASLNYRDLMVVKGLYDPKLALPRIPFSDGVGAVVAVGEGVTRVKVGDRVAGLFFQKWIGGELTQEIAQSALGGAIEGILAEYALLHEDGVVRVPEHLTDEEAASLPCAAVTAWNALFHAGNLKAGDTVLVQGTGGVSIFALQFALLAGAKVIATSSSNEKLERVRKMGAAETINYKQTPEWGSRVRELTDDKGVDYVVEVGGARTLSESLHAVRHGGQISLIGVLSGGKGEVATAAILMKNVRVQGIYVGSREMFAAMNSAIALHKLRPVVDRVYPFHEVPEALKYMESGSHFGKICIRF
ncbi:zinc-dependent alcohol dehydrogenase family protein [Chroogloeocystis siderophila]|jgi:NADPH:quinone reductase-like Zn-dependent oxidoreductase|uniref:NAD(P)-dependent alcohol dehydrogenase n=1 Tax=Chroogloeocystis siderophila 5.2 s.c.1 TaxID=247279 RepID=A0A1U7HYW9_9CHRO|nr:NAD(P)-dependent alcohol dehydrogenase [Chroogloeocystis siderophila]OKH28753.1 NAD(P)-dependent alcohol dehydrogenase [Chroogloeocystis siderophila 5.2 s.c.1]